MSTEIKIIYIMQNSNTDTTKVESEQRVREEKGTYLSSMKSREHV